MATQLDLFSLPYHINIVNRYFTVTLSFTTVGNACSYIHAFLDEASRVYPVLENLAYIHLCECVGTGKNYKVVLLDTYYPVNPPASD